MYKMAFMVSKKMYLPLISVLILIFASCKDDFVINDGSVWATGYHIVYRSDADLHDSVRVELERVEMSLSMFKDESTVSRINSNSTTLSDPMFRELFESARPVYSLSDGAFDPTVGPLVELWGFGRNRNPRIPSGDEIADALEAVGFGDCHIDSMGAVVKKSPATVFDFSAIAKGFGVDMVARMLERNGCRDYMVEIGGEICVSGLNAKGRPWRIQIDAPVPADTPADLHRRLTVKELGPEPVAIATSGNYRNFRTDSLGQVIGHTMNPKTGYPVATATLSATVLARECVLADALATACMAMEADSALAMLSRCPGVEGLLVLSDGNGGYVLRMND